MRTCWESRTVLCWESFGGKKWAKKVHLQKLESYIIYVMEIYIAPPATVPLPQRILAFDTIN